MLTSKKGTLRGGRLVQCPIRISPQKQTPVRQKNNMIHDKYIYGDKPKTCTCCARGVLTALSGFLMPNEMSYCKHGDREAHNGWPKIGSVFWVVFSSNFSNLCQRLNLSIPDWAKVQHLSQQASSLLLNKCQCSLINMCYVN